MLLAFEKKTPTEDPHQRDPWTGYTQMAEVLISTRWFAVGISDDEVHTRAQVQKLYGTTEPNNSANDSP